MSTLTPLMFVLQGATAVETGREEADIFLSCIQSDAFNLQILKCCLMKTAQGMWDLLLLWWHRCVFIYLKHKKKKTHNKFKVTAKVQSIEKMIRLYFCMSLQPVMRWHTNEESNSGVKCL